MLKIIPIIASIWLTSWSCTKNEGIVEELNAYPCNEKIEGLIFSKNYETVEMVLKNANISLDSSSIVYGFTNPTSQQVYLACNFPEELQSALGKNINVTCKVFDIINVDVREIPIELLNYEILK